MKRILCLLTLLFVTSQALAVGVEFQAGYSNYVGLNINVTDQLEIKPQIAFNFGGNSSFGLIADVNYYFFESMDLRHYAGGGIELDFMENQDTRVFLNGQYGLRYNVNEVISLFGEVGIGMAFDPEFVLYSVHPGLGLTFNIR